MERRLGTTFVGLDCGWNVINDHRIYGRDLEYVVCSGVDKPPTQRVTIAGHINEGDDLLGEDVPFPQVAEGDIVVARAGALLREGDPVRPVTAAISR